MTSSRTAKHASQNYAMIRSTNIRVRCPDPVHYLDVPGGEGARRMDPDKFDALVKRLIAAQNRRQAVAGAVGGALASLGVTAVTESRRKRGKGGNADRGKSKQRHRRNEKDGRRDDESVARLGRRHRKRKREQHKDERHKEKKKKKKEKKEQKRDDRCQKNGRPCLRDSKCCSNHCDSTTGTCTRQPAS
jgi:hypothetical protein